jgi:isopropylmalate/citramalate/homocitrate synthase-like protein
VFLKLVERYVRIFDTTLRDGEQTPGVTLTPEEKLEIAKQLDKLCVDTIEAGFPIASRGEAEAVKLIAKAGLNAEICGLARVERADIDAALDAGVSCIHLFIATSDIHLTYKLKMSRQQALEKAIWGVEYAKKHGVTVEFSAEDATRTDPQFLKEFYKEVVKAGADRVDIPDTVGVSTPARLAQLVREVKSVVDVPIAVHCHNDFGLAVANSLAAVEAGASEVHVTVNGLGERAGNAALEEVVMALHNLYGIKTRVNTRAIYETSRLVSKLTGVVVQPNKAIVGDNAFAHESGIHTHGVLALPFTYEPLDPEVVGRRRWLQAGKHAGSHGIRAQLQEMGFSPTEEQLAQIVSMVKEIADKGKTLTDSDLEEIARSVLKVPEEEERVLQLNDLAVMTGINVVPTASVKLTLDGQVYVASATGVGPVDAAVKAIQSITERVAKIALKEYRLEALTGGSDAIAEVMVKVEDSEGNISSARGVGEDIVVASVQALIKGMNKLLIKQKKAKSNPK